MIDQLDMRLQQAAQYFWDSRSGAQAEQLKLGRADTGARGAVTAGAHMGEFELIIADLLEESGLRRTDIYHKSHLELPGYFRPEKQWDLLAISDGRLVAAIEFKSQVGPSFGNNFNNRVEEAIGNATDLWTAFRDGHLGSFRPFLGYVFLLEDTKRVHAPIKVKAPHFEIDPIFQNTSYCQRYELFCQRLILERLYDGVCLATATDSTPTQITMPRKELDFRQFSMLLQKHAQSFAAIFGT